jgi:hypothetical protein
VGGARRPIVAKQARTRLNGFSEIRAEEKKKKKMGIDKWSSSSHVSRPPRGIAMYRVEKL